MWLLITVLWGGEGKTLLCEVALKPLLVEDGGVNGARLLVSCIKLEVKLNSGPVVFVGPNELVLIIPLTLPSLLAEV